MGLNKKVFEINAGEVSAKIEDFIRKMLKRLNRNGIVVPISGGLDSSVIAALCVRAVGKDKVIGLMLPEKHGNPEAEKFAILLAKDLGIKTDTRDISSHLSSLGTYEGTSAKAPKFISKVFISIKKRNLLKDNLSGNDSKIVRQGIADINSKGRIRLVELYRFAEPRNLMTVGSAHKSEDLVGLYVKFGVDDLADIMPLKNLYRTQILQLAEYLKIPEEILERTPNPDIIPGVEDKYKDILGVDSENVDLILYGFEKNMKEEEISRQLKINIKKIKDIKEIINNSWHMRNASLAPELDMINNYNQ